MRASLRVWQLTNIHEVPGDGSLASSWFLGVVERRETRVPTPCRISLPGHFAFLAPSSACGTSVVRWMPDPYTSKSQGSGWANCQSPMVGRKIGCKSGKRGATGRLREARSVGVTVDNFRGNGCAMLKDSPRGNHG